MKEKISYIAIVVSILSILLVLCRVEPMAVDWMSVLVGILALLVAVLVGW